MYDKEEVAKDPSPLHFPVDSLNCFNDKDCERIQENGIPYNKSFLLEGKFDNMSVSRPFRVFNNSHIVLIDGQIPDTSSGKPGHALYLCNLLASLVPSNFVVDPRVSDVLQSSFSDSNVMQELYRNKTPNDITNVGFSEE